MAPACQFFSPVCFHLSSRKGEPGNPAVYIERPGQRNSTPALKKASELLKLDEGEVITLDACLTFRPDLIPIFLALESVIVHETLFPFPQSFTIEGAALFLQYLGLV